MADKDRDFPPAAERALAAAPTVADVDPDETREWLDALDAVVHADGKERAQYLFDRLADHALTRGVQSARARITPYRNTIPHTAQPPYPGDLELEARLGAAAHLVLGGQRDRLDGDVAAEHRIVGGVDDAVGAAADLADDLALDFDPGPGDPLYQRDQAMMSRGQRAER